MEPNLRKTQKHSSDRDTVRAAARIVGTYLAVGLIWIYASDQIVAAFSTSLRESERFQTIKGTFFVVATGAMLWILFTRHLRQLERVNIALFDSEGRLRSLLGCAPIPTVVVRNGVFEYVNDAARALLGGPTSLVGTPVMNLIAKESVDEIRNLFTEGCDTEGTPRKRPGPGKAERIPQVALVSVGGKRILAEFVATPLPHDPQASLIALVDITERTRLESIARDLQKMEAVATLTASVTHEFNNTLTAIMGLASIGSQRLDPGSPAAIAFERIQAVGGHATGITRSLLTLCRTSPSHKQARRLSPTVEGAIDLVRGILPHSVTLRVDTASLQGHWALIDPAQIKQALLNLGINARDAMPTGGNLTIRGSVVTGTKGEHWAQISVEDSGPGIAADVLPEIFTPFFTTKPPGKGTGLGLPVTKGIIDEHKGTIGVTSASSAGTTFTISLPLVEQTEPSTVELNRAKAPAGAGKLVLLGEDNASVRRVLEETLSGAGYTVIAVNDGMSVLNAYTHNINRIAAVVLDIGLPGMSGIECLTRIRAESPAIAAILTTGGTRPELPRSLIDHTAFLSKPFPMDDLLDTLGALLPMEEVSTN
ncbi:MAG: ATP-binding protein [Planctomycetota bacterium]